jgi:hypothetical protein
MTVKDFSQAPVDAKNMAKAIQLAMAEATRRIATIGSEVIIDATPVLTTRAVSNWKVYIGRMQAPELQPMMKGDGSKDTAGMRGSAVKRLKKVESAERIKFYKKGTQPIWITNSVPYIKVLENGGPKNRANNMVAKGLLAMRLYGNTIQILHEAAKQKV